MWHLNVISLEAELHAILNELYVLSAMHSIAHMSSWQRNISAVGVLLTMDKTHEELACVNLIHGSLHMLIRFNINNQRLHNLIPIH